MVPSANRRHFVALCGITGLKPTYGRVSRLGMVAFASSLDQGGPLAQTAADCATMLSAIAGFDAADSTSAERDSEDFSAALDGDITGLRIGIPAEYFGEGLDDGIESAVQAALREFEQRGAQLIDISLPHSHLAVPAYYVIAPAEASTNLSRFDGVRYGHRCESPADLHDLYTRTREEGFGAEVKRRILVGTYALSAGYYDAYYRKAQQLRTLFRQDFTGAFAHCDALVAPVSPVAAFRLGEHIDDPLQMYLGDIITIPVNLAGLPAMSLPCGFTGQQLPIGLQVIAPPFHEETIFQVAAAFEASTQFHTRRPALPV